MSNEPDLPHSHSLERKLATILSADVAEFSRLMNEDEEGTLRIFRGHKEVFESLVAMHRGRVFNTAGDAILAEFASAVEAVRCATDIQTALRTRNDKLPLERQVRFRIGINLGDVMVQGQDLLGDGVNVAARLQTAAEPGGICISGSVHDQIRNKLSLSFQPLGERNFKNIPQPVRTFSVVETESGTLPSPKPLGSTNNAARYFVIGGLIFLLAAGGYWAYKRNAHGSQKLAAASPVGLTAPSEEPSPDLARSAAAGSPSSPKQTSASPAENSSSSEPKPEKDPLRSVPRSSPKSDVPARPAHATPVATPSPFDGLYLGQVCFAETQMEPRRCIQGQGTVTGTRISGQWTMGREGRLTMFVDGSVSPSGKVVMEMHSERNDGSRVATIDFTGTIHDGNLDATGRFRMGRPATLSWHKKERASHESSQP